MKEKCSIFIFVLYAVLVAYLSLSPGGGEGFLVAPYDKVAHLITYTVFALIAFAMTLSPRQLVAVIVGIVVYGALMEVGQSFVPGRHMSVLDLLANILGVLLGGWLGAKFLLST